MSYTLPSDWLTVSRGEAPLVVSLPHTGTHLPPELLPRLVSPWLATRDADWWIDRLYDFAGNLGATVIRTAISRTFIDVNRDPSGASLYPGQATTELCPTMTFDGDPLYRPGMEPDAADIEMRRALAFEPYHAALRAELDRLRAKHRRVVLYDCHSIRSVIPRLFEGELPLLNVGTNDETSCDIKLQERIEWFFRTVRGRCVSNGRFRGGYITRHYGEPQRGIHAVQMEVACRFYMEEPAEPPNEQNWPTPYDPYHAAFARETFFHLLRDCLDFARTG